MNEHTTSRRRLTVPALAAAAAMTVIAAGCASDASTTATATATSTSTSTSTSTLEATAPPSPTASDGGPVRLLAIGDSVLDWSGSESTPEQVGAALSSRGIDTEVVNRSIGGSCLVNCGDPGEDQIPARYIDGDWTHVLISGGGNDLGEFDEGNCRSPDGLMSADLQSGAMVDLVDRMPSDATVLLYRYSAAVPDENFCPEVWTLMERYTAFAAARPNVVLADSSMVSGPDTPDLWDDEVHPSEQGSQVIGAMIADLIVTGGPER